VRLELGARAQHLLRDVAAAKDDFYDKALEVFRYIVPNQGEVCTCPSAR